MPLPTGFDIPYVKCPYCPETIPEPEHAKMCDHWVVGHILRNAQSHNWLVSGSLDVPGSDEKWLELLAVPLLKQEQFDTTDIPHAVEHGAVSDIEVNVLFSEKPAEMAKHLKELHRVCTSSEQLSNEVYALVYNESHVFEDGEGEATIESLQDAAKECERIKRGFLARQLKNLADDVKKRIGSQ